MSPLASARVLGPLCAARVLCAAICGVAVEALQLAVCGGGPALWRNVMAARRDGDGDEMREARDALLELGRGPVRGVVVDAPDHANGSLLRATWNVTIRLMSRQ